MRTLKAIVLISTVLLAGPVFADITGMTTPPAGGNTQVQFNKRGAFGADPNFTYSTSTLNLTVSTITAQKIIVSTLTVSTLTVSNLDPGVMMVVGTSSQIVTNLVSLSTQVTGTVSLSTQTNGTVSLSTQTNGLLSLSTQTTGSVSLSTQTNGLLSLSTQVTSQLPLVYLQSTGTWAINGATLAYTNGVSSGTRIDSTTTTLQGAGINGTATNNSTTTFTGGYPFKNGIAVSTYTGPAPVFQVNTTSITAIGMPFYSQGADVNISTIQLSCRGAHISTYSSNGAVGAVTIAATDVWQNYLSFTVPAGVWEIWGTLSFNTLTSTSVTNMDIAISSYSANTTTDHIWGVNETDWTGNSGTFPSGKIHPLYIMPFEVNLAVATTYYLKGLVSFTTNSTNMRVGSMRATRK